MGIEKHINGRDVMSVLSSVLDEIVRDGTVFIVETEEPNWRGDSAFVLGPESVCGAVLGLIDPEYGWPKKIDMEHVGSIAELAPSHRQHPFVYRNDTCVAVSIQVSEYEMIKKRLECK